MRQVVKDSTNISVDLYIIDSTDRTPETGVLFNTAGMDLEYRREGGLVVNITEVALDCTPVLTDPHTDGGFLEIGHGLYRLDVPDAAFATGAETVSIQGTVTGMIVLPVTIQLIDPIADQVWDEVISTSAHNNAQSSGQRLRRSAGLIQSESAVNDACATTLQFDTDLTEPDDFWNDALLVFISGDLAGQSKPIQDYAMCGGAVTLDEAFTAAPANNDEFIIFSTHIHPVTQISDVVWDEVRSGHTTQGTYGEVLGINSIISGTVDTVTNTHTPTTTIFQADDIVELTADHFIGRVVVFLTGVLAGQATDITDYAAVGCIGQFTVTALTEAPANNDTFVIV